MPVLNYADFSRRAERLRLNMLMVMDPLAVNLKNRDCFSYDTENQARFDFNRPGEPWSSQKARARISIDFISKEHADAFEQVFTAHGLYITDPTATTLCTRRVLNWAVASHQDPDNCFTSDNINDACQALSDKIYLLNHHDPEVEGKWVPVEVANNLASPIPVTVAATPVASTGGYVPMAHARTLEIEALDVARLPESNKNSCVIC